MFFPQHPRQSPAILEAAIRGHIEVVRLLLDHPKMDLSLHCISYVLNEGTVLQHIDEYLKIGYIDYCREEFSTDLRNNIEVCKDLIVARTKC